MNPWHFRFQENTYLYGTEPNVFLKNMQNKFHFSGEALAIAEGEGRNAVFLAEQGLDVTAWDYAESGLEKTTQLAKLKGVSVKTKLVDLEDANWQNNQWDQLFCIFGHFPSELRKKTLQGIKDTIKPGGHFVTEVYSTQQIPYQSGGPKDLDYLYTPNEFLTTFSDWKFIHFFMGEVERHEGKMHKGMSHVIQFVGQKPF